MAEELRSFFFWSTNPQINDSLIYKALSNVVNILAVTLGTFTNGDERYHYLD